MPFSTQDTSIKLKEKKSSNDHSVLVKWVKFVSVSLTKITSLWHSFVYHIIVRKVHDQSDLCIAQMSRTSKNTFSYPVWTEMLYEISGDIITFQEKKAYTSWRPPHQDKFLNYLKIHCIDICWREKKNI